MSDDPKEPQDVESSRRVFIVNNNTWARQKKLNEGERHKVTSYRYILPQNTRYKHRRISVGNCRVLFDIDLKVKDWVVDVWIEISPPNNTHPNHYATNALPKDPAIRLAFLVEYTNDTTNEQVKAYAFFQGYSAVCRANTLVDRIAEGRADMDIFLTPRRYLEVSQLKALKRKGAIDVVPERRFTDDLLGLDREGDYGDEEEDEDEK